MCHCNLRGPGPFASDVKSLDLRIEFATVVVQNVPGGFLTCRPATGVGG